jgi:hypothetical protein
MTIASLFNFNISLMICVPTSNRENVHPRPVVVDKTLHSLAGIWIDPITLDALKQRLVLEPPSLNNPRLTHRITPHAGAEGALYIAPSPKTSASRL